MFFLCVGGGGGCVLNERVVWWRVGFRVNNGYKPNLFCKFANSKGTIIVADIWRITTLFLFNNKHFIFRCR